MNSSVRNTSYRKKLRFLLLGIIAFTLLAWFLSISRTVDLMVECSTLQEAAEMNNTVAGTVSELRQELMLLDSLTGSPVDSGSNYQEILLDKTGRSCLVEGSVLSNFSPTFLAQTKEYSILTNSIDMEGTFPALVKTLYRIENEPMAGTIVSVDFCSEKEIRSGRLKLVSTIYVQLLQNTDDEKVD